MIQTLEMASGHRMAPDEMNTLWQPAGRGRAYLALGAAGIGHYRPRRGQFTLCLQELKDGAHRSG